MGTDDRRRFSDGERVALYLAADGKCTTCGIPLQPGWHADHVHPWSADGATDVINGQALCPSCNLTKGAQVPVPTSSLRAWQQVAARRFHNSTARDFLVCATPGAGKTKLALTLAKEAIDDGSALRVAVVVPTDALRVQWADEAAQFGLHLMPAQAAEDYEKEGYHGCVVTYQQLGIGVGASLLRRSTRHTTFAICDEIHHAGRDRKWGAGLELALDSAKRRLTLSGTPWRSDPASRIPFVEYSKTDGRVIVDHSYEYGEAVQDGVCRVIAFNNYEGDARWVSAGVESEARLGDTLRDEDVAAALDAALDPRNEWMPTLLRAAAEELESIREEIPDAGGLVVAHTQDRAREYAAILETITGEVPTIVLSEEADAKLSLDQFRTSRRRWLVAVKMVSEGVDIPRLTVGVYAPKIRTPLFFRQVIGRLVRVRPDEYVIARLFMPAVPALMAHAREIEQELRDVYQEQDDDSPERNQSFQQTLFDLETTSLYASPAEPSSLILEGKDISQQQRELAEAWLRERCIPPMYLPNVAGDFAGTTAVLDAAPLVTTPAAPVVTSRARQEKQLRGEIERLVRVLARQTGVEHKQINWDLKVHVKTDRKSASLTQLRTTHDLLLRWIQEAQ